MSQDEKVMEGAVNLARRWSVLNEPDMLQVRNGFGCISEKKILLPLSHL